MERIRVSRKLWLYLGIFVLARCLILASFLGITYVALVIGVRFQSNEGQLLFLSLWAVSLVFTIAFAVILPDEITEWRELRSGKKTEHIN